MAKYMVPSLIRFVSPLVVPVYFPSTVPVSMLNALGTFVATGLVTVLSEVFCCGRVFLFLSMPLEREVARLFRSFLTDPLTGLTVLPAESDGSFTVLVLCAREARRSSVLVEGVRTVFVGCGVGIICFRGA